jgi:hypothetical protein
MIQIMQMALPLAQMTMAQGSGHQMTKRKWAERVKHLPRLTSVLLLNTLLRFPTGMSYPKVKYGYLSMKR